MKYFILLIFSIISLKAISLDDAISYALKHNNTLQQANLNVKNSKQQKEIKKAENFGHINVIASYEHYNLSRTLVPLAPLSISSSPSGAYEIPTTKNLFNAGLTYNVTLFNGFAQQNLYKISDLQYENSKIKNKLNHEELIYNVRILYISLLALEEQLEAQSLYTLSEKRLLENINKQRKAGTKSKLDFLRAKNAVEASKAQETILEANIAILKANLSATFGDKEFDKTEPISIEVQNHKFPSVVINELQRYQASKLNIEVSKKKKELTKASYYPVVDFSAYYGKNFAPNDTTNILPSTGSTIIDKGDWHNESVWQVGLHLKWNIFDFGVKSAKYEESNILYLKSKLESENVVITLQKNIVTAQNKIKLAQAEFKSRKSQYSLLTETEKIEQIRYDNNALTLTDLLSTQAKKTIAKAQMINAKYNYQKAIYYLDYLFEKGEK